MQEPTTRPSSTPVPGPETAEAHPTAGSGPAVAALLEYAASDRPTPAERPVIAQILAFARAQPGCLLRSCQPGHLTGSAWVLRADRAAVVLLHHRKLDRWLQPGGHADGDPLLSRVAAREAQEETGLEGLRLLQPEIFDVDVHPIPARPGEPAHLHHDLRFVFIAPPGAELRPNAESKAIAWVRRAELPRYTVDASVARLAKKWAP